MYNMILKNKNSMSDIYLLVTNNRINRADRFLYDIDGEYYDTISLSHFTGEIGRVITRIKINFQRLNSLGFIAITNLNQSEWFVATIDSNNVTIIYWSDPNVLSRSMDDVHPLSIPNLTGYIPGQSEIPRILFPNVVFNRYTDIVDRVNEGSLLSIQNLNIDSEHAIIPEEQYYTIRVNESNIYELQRDYMLGWVKLTVAQPMNYNLRIGDIVRKIVQPEKLTYPNTLVSQSYETLIKRLYGILVELPEFLIINDLRVNFISFQDTASKLQNNEIERYIVDPLLQPWAGVPGTLNRILTLFTRNGMTYLVKVQYNQETAQIFPPI